MNIKTMLPPKKVVWKSFASVIDIGVWLFIFGSLNFKDIKTLGVMSGIFIWTFVDFEISRRMENKDKNKFKRIKKMAKIKKNAKTRVKAGLTLKRDMTATGMVMKKGGNKKMKGMMMPTT